MVRLGKQRLSEVSIRRPASILASLRPPHCYPLYTETVRGAELT